MRGLKIERRLKGKERSEVGRELLWPYVGSGYSFGQHRYGIFLLSESFIGQRSY